MKGIVAILDQLRDVLDILGNGGGLAELLGRFLEGTAAETGGKLAADLTHGWGLYRAREKGKRP